jgi:hypothetical protein
MAIYQNFTQAQNQLRGNVKPFTKLTPDYFLDVSLTTGANNGLTPEDAWQTVTQMNTVLLKSGVVGTIYAGKTLGIKRGTTITEQVKFLVNCPVQRPFRYSTRRA